MNFDGQFLISILQIIWIDILLSGDNAVVIALACRSLPKGKRRLGMGLGAGAAIGLRILFALIITSLLAVSYLKIVGGALLLWIAIKLALGEDREHRNIDDTESLLKAVGTIAVADAVMSLDNVIAISAASRGHPQLFIFGLLLSIPLIVVGSALIMNLITRFPIFIWAGAALLGWIAAEMMVSDPAFVGWLQNLAPQWVKELPVDINPIGVGPVDSLLYGAALAGAVFVASLGLILKRRAHKPLIEESEDG